MSKLATVGFSITEASSNQGEGNQFDLGPYTTAASNTSPGDFAVTNFPATFTALNPGDGNPIFLVIQPVTATTGCVPRVQANVNDAGLLLSDANPTFMPVIQTVADPTTFWAGLVTTAAPLNIGWV